MTPEFLEDVADPLQASFSRRMTLLFLRANSLATDRPTTPPPITTDSAKTVSILRDTRWCAVEDDFFDLVLFNIVSNYHLSSVIDTISIQHS